MAGRSRVLAGVAAAVLLVGGSLGFLAWRERQRTEERVTTLLRDVERELAADPRAMESRDALSGLVRRVGSDPLGEQDPRLVRARARLELALGRPRNAWDLLQASATSADATVDDLALGARISARMADLAGDRAQMERALVLAERAANARAEREDLSFAWRVASRLGRAEDAGRFARLLQERHAESPEARAVALLGAFTPAQGEAMYPQLQALARETGLPELELALAGILLQRASSSDHEDALRRLEELLAQHESWLEVRNAMALVLHRLGRVADRDRQLQWLLERAGDDPRAPVWRQLLGAAGEKR